MYKIEERMYGDAAYTVVTKNGKIVKELWSHDKSERLTAAQEVVQSFIEDDNWHAMNR